jgi:hypothetical protein
MKIRNKTFSFNNFRLMSVSKKPFTTVISIFFGKISHFENMRAGFHRRSQNSLWQNSPEMMACKKKFLINIMS